MFAKQFSKMCFLLADWHVKHVRPHVQQVRLHVLNVVSHAQHMWGHAVSSHLITFSQLPEEVGQG